MSDNGSGSFGEKFAADIIKQHGYDILATNYKTKFGEIDIIAANGEYIAFIEVKTRSKGYLVSPLQAVTASKRKRIITAAYQYLQKYPSSLQPRFDVFEAVIKSKTDYSVINYNYIEGAFDATGYNGYY